MGRRLPRPANVWTPAQPGTILEKESTSDYLHPDTLATTHHPPTTAEQWREAYGLQPERDVPFTTLSGTPVAPLYTADDAPGDPGHPGVYPYTRGVYPSMYRGRLW